MNRSYPIEAWVVGFYNSGYANGTYRPHKFHKTDSFNPNYSHDLAEYEKWLDDCWRLVQDATRAANWFADIVRRDINPPELDVFGQKASPGRLQKAARSRGFGGSDAQNCYQLNSR
jgi:hypothetical protein